MDRVVSEPNVDRSLRLSLFDAFLYSLMVGIGETYLPAFALSVGLGEIFSGILSSLPLVSGAVLQLFTPKGLRHVRSHKSWVVLTVLIQALAFLPLIYYSFGQTPHFLTLFLILTLYWGAGFSVSPSWNYWMGRLVPPEQGPKYFSMRARVNQLGILIGLVIGGIALHNKIAIFHFTSAFGGLFFIAFLARVGSSIFLSRKMFRVEWDEPKHRALGLIDSWKIFWASPPKRKFFLWLFPYMACVYISAPFVTPYFLAKLNLDYGAYMIAIAALMLGKMAVLLFVGRNERSWSGFRLMMAGVLCMSPLPIFWGLSGAFPFVLFLQFVSGMALGAFEVGLSLIFFKDLGFEEKVPVLTVYNLFNACSVIVGTLLGGWLLATMGEQFLRNYLILFAVGGVLRVIFSRPLLKAAKDWQDQKLAASSHL